jgi:hypothetical protein
MAFSPSDPQQADIARQLRRAVGLHQRGQPSIGMRRLCAASRAGELPASFAVAPSGAAS